MANPINLAAILVPGGEVFVTEGGDTLKGTNTANRCRHAVRLRHELLGQGYNIVVFFSSGTADHPGQITPTGALIAECIRSLDPQAACQYDDQAWDTGQNVQGFRRLLRHHGWWPRWRRPRADLFVVSEDCHTLRMQVLFLRRYACVVHRRPTNDPLTPEQERFERKLYWITWIPFSEYLMTWHAKRLRQAARAQ